MEIMSLRTCQTHYFRVMLRNETFFEHLIVTLKCGHGFWGPDPGAADALLS